MYVQRFQVYRHGNMLAYIDGDDGDYAYLRFIEGGKHYPTRVPLTCFDVGGGYELVNEEWIPPKRRFMEVK